MVTRLWQHLTGVAGYSSSDDDVPLATLITKPQPNENPLHEAANSSTMESNNNSGKDKSVPMCSDGSSDDDVPLIKLKFKQEKPVRKTSVPARRSPVLAGMEDTSDDEPLINKTKTSPLAQNTECILSTFHPVPMCSDGSSDDDVPLIKLKCKQEKPVRKTSLPARRSPVLAGMEDTSDDEPLINKTKTTSLAQNTESNGKKLDCTNGTENKTTAGMEDTSDDEPLINKTKTSSLAQKAESTGKILDCTNGTDLTKEDGSDEEPLMRVTKVSSKTVGKTTTFNTDQKGETRASDDEPLIKTRNTSSPAQESNGKELDCTENKTTVPMWSDGSSDEDVPLIKLKCKQEKPVRKTSVPARRSPVLAGLEDTSDDEPLIKKTKTSSLAQKAESNGKKQDCTNGTENKTTVLLCSDGSSDDDVPLAKLKCKQEKPVRKTSVPARRSPVLDDSSEDEPLINGSSLLAKKLSSNDIKRKSSNGNSKIKKSAVPLCSDSSSDDVPLAKLICKQEKPVRTSVPARSSTVLESSSVSHRSCLNAVTGEDFGELGLILSTDSSDDEPLINIKKRTAKPLEITTVLKMILEKCSVVPEHV